MAKKKLGRPPKSKKEPKVKHEKPDESIPEEPEEVSLIEDPPAAEEIPSPEKIIQRSGEKLCECGKPALPNNHQCYACSHRS